MRKSKIRVAFFAEILQDEFDGASRTMFQIINRIPKAHFEFLFICGVGPKTDIGFEVMEIPAIQIPFNRTYKMAIPFMSQNLIQKKLNQFSPDIIHIASPSALGHFGLQYGKQNQIPALSIYHTHFISYVDYYLKSFQFLIPGMKKLISNSQKKFYDDCDVIYVPTQTMIDELSTFSFATSHMKLWQRGIDNQLFNPRKRDVQFMRKITGNDKPCILFASRLVWEKNLQTLIDIYNQSEQEHLDLNFIVVGDGVALPKMKAEMPDAYFLGKMSHESLAKVYASSDVFLFPSISETYGNVVIEAMASGLPCVIANGGGTKSFVNHCINGFKCEPNDAADYLDKIQLVLKSRRLRSEFINISLEKTKKLNWETLVETYFSDLQALSTPAFAMTA